MSGFKMPYPPVNCQYGAPMGRNAWDEHREEPIKFHLARVPGRSYGDYDPGGAYWGDLWRSPLFQAYGFTPSGEPQRLFVRARNRNEAKEAVLKVFKNGRFYR